MHLFVQLAVLLVPSLAWTIGPPRSNQDWRQLAGLVTDSFDAPDESAPLRERLAWLVQEPLVYQSTLRHHIATANKMRGKKYAVVVAKDMDRVVGVAEIGIKMDATDAEDETPSRRPTIGSLCVKAEYRQQGIGRTLVNECQRLVERVWKDNVIFVEVRVDNDRALCFFQALGYEASEQQILVQVQYRQQRIERPHYLLNRQLNETLVEDAKSTTTNKQWIWGES